MSFDVFISYNHASQAKVHEIEKLLSENKNLNVWIDVKFIGNGENLYLKTNEGLIKSKAVIAFVTKEYINNQTCRNELALAVSYRKPLFIVMMERLKAADLRDISAYLSNVRRCNLYKLTSENKWTSEGFKLDILIPLGNYLGLDLLEIGEKKKEKLPVLKTDEWIDSLEYSNDIKWKNVVYDPVDVLKDGNC